MIGAEDELFMHTHKSGAMIADEERMLLLRFMFADNFGNDERLRFVDQFFREFSDLYLAQCIQP